MTISEEASDDSAAALGCSCDNNPKIWNRIPNRGKHALCRVSDASICFQEQIDLIVLAIRHEFRHVMSIFMIDNRRIVRAVTEIYN